MRRFFSVLAVSAGVIVSFFYLRPPSPEPSASLIEPAVKGPDMVLTTVRRGETLESIFKRNGFSKGEFREIFGSSSKIYNLSKISVGDIFLFEVDRDSGSVLSMEFGIDDDSLLSVERKDGYYVSRRGRLPVSVKTGSFGITIKDNLISSMPDAHRDYMKLAMQLSDIFAWDLDFSSDIREGDTVRFLVEEKWSGNAFRGYGEIIAAEFVNDGRIMKAYRYVINGQPSYFDDSGRSLRKTLLRSPLKFKYISSGFMRRRLHPILRIYRPHLGVDYAAPTGTPVSAAGEGRVMFAGYKGQNGRMVKIKHPGGYVTYYGHLSRIARKIRRGTKVSQGDIIGYVGATGLATGPHLDYRIKHSGRFVNPLRVRLPRGRPVSPQLMKEYLETAAALDAMLESITPPVYAGSAADGRKG